MFKLNNIDQYGIRHGRIKTAHGILETPIFLPDATRGYVKTLSNSELDEAGIEAMVVNTYHLYLQPGVDLLKKFKGVHDFTGWQKPLLSDSGGYQVFSLIRNLNRSKNKRPLGKITDEGVYFKSPLNGQEHFISPEKSIAIQFDLGTDMIVCLDDCPPNDSSREELSKSIGRTVAWAERCWKEYYKQIKKRKLAREKRPLIFSVIQGGMYNDLRRLCFDGLQSVAKKNANSLMDDWDGYGFGARPVDSQGKFLKSVLKFTADLIPENRLRFALGIGTPEDIWECARLGWDMFDCVIPTREARHGRLYENKKRDLISSGKIYYNVYNITNSKFAGSKRKINESGLKSIKNTSQGYLNYLYKTGDALGQKLSSINNLNFYSNLIKTIRNIN